MATNSQSEAIPSLQESAEDATLKALGKLSKNISSRFCCGGKLQPAQSVVCLNYEFNGEIAKIVFPGADEAALAKLLQASSVASFGKGDQQVTDLSYRDAYKIDPDKLMTSFCPYSTNIISEIETLMVPNRRIRAELHKLNLYTGPGGHFTSHVDTPRSGDMFGSLVICLPTQFSGGALVTRYGDQEVVFDWSSLPGSPPSEVSWAAFFSDVEHEILPVSAGNCLTLIYKLFVVHERLHSIPSGNPFYNCLQTAICTPHFMRGGGCLAFNCDHLYAFGLLNEKVLLPHILKGTDYLIFSSAKLLDLRVTVKPVIKGLKFKSLLPYFPHKMDDGFSGECGRNPFTELLDEDSCDFHQVYEWDMMQYSISTKDHPTLLDPDNIKICGSEREVTWSSVFNYIKTPVRASAEMLEEANVWMDASSLEEAGVCKEDIPILLGACNKVLCSRWQKNPTLGAYVCHEDSAHNMYQTAFILIEVPPWGDFPRRPAADLESPGAEKKENIEHEYRHIFDDDDKKFYCWKRSRY